MSSELTYSECCYTLSACGTGWWVVPQRSTTIQCEIALPYSYGHALKANAYDSVGPTPNEIGVTGDGAGIQ